MTDSIYLEIVKPINQCSIVGHEKLLISQRTGNERITVLRDNFGQYRALLKDCKNNAIKSAIVFDQFRTVRFKYTRSEYRGDNSTAFLMSMLPFLTGLTFRHSDYLTSAGKNAIKAA